MIMSFIAFLLSLPLAVFTYASVLGVIDQPDKPPAILRIIVPATIVLLLCLLAGPESRSWVGYGFLSVAILHIAVYTSVRLLVLKGIWITDRIE